jgi:hypothetical protein
MERNVFLYWVGKEYKLVSILRNLIYLHSKNGKGYTVHLINESNIHEYIKELPDCFYQLCPSNQADFVRVNVIYDYGGIWLDSDTIVLNSLDSLFDLQNGFFVLENNTRLCNGIFGAKKNSELMLKWKEQMLFIIKEKKNISWTEIGSNILEKLFKENPGLYDNISIFKGLDTIYPVNWNNCVKEYIEKPYENYKNLLRENQPIIVLVNSVYKAIEHLSLKEILNGNMPMNYFINKSFENMNHLINYDFIEIGTSNFDTLIQSENNNLKGISVEPVKYYLDSLPSKENVLKLNLAISNINSIIDIYYIKEDDIIKYNLPSWFKGCNSINDYHPLHKKHNLTHLCKIDKVKVIPTFELFYTNKVKSLNYLKIDTEGHDCIILENLYFYLNSLPTYFYPKKILFETNENSNKNDVDKIISLYLSLGYSLISKGYDTILEIIN